MKTLKILHAGCVTSEVERARYKFSEEFPYKPVNSISDGSINCMRRILNGESFDIIITADSILFDLMLHPNHINGYIIFAGNNMSLISRDKKSVLNSNNWIDLLKDQNNSFGYYNPDVDPGGYRSVMACKLADNYIDGLTEIMLNHKNKQIQMNKEDKKSDLFLGYHSNAIKSNNPFVDLPDIMSLGNSNFESIYNKVSYNFGEKTIKGTTIKHALSILKNSKDKDFAIEFINIFLSIDFEKQGFKKFNENKIVGKNPLER